MARIRIGDALRVGALLVDRWRLCRCDRTLEVYMVPRKVIALGLLWCPGCGVACQIDGPADVDELMRGRR